MWQGKTRCKCYDFFNIRMLCYTFMWIIHNQNKCWLCLWIVNSWLSFWNMGSLTLKAPVVNAEWRISVSELYQNLYMYYYWLVLIWYSSFKFWYAWTLEKTEGTIKNWQSINIANIYSGCVLFTWKYNIKFLY
jgi:hypothetical protein